MLSERASQIRSWLEPRESDLVGLLANLVNQDSGTYDPTEVNQVGEILASAVADSGFTIRRVAGSTYGDHVVATRPGIRGERRLLCLGHMDTVFPSGTAASRPFQIKDGRATGPGVLDMKGGLVLLVFALRALQATDSPAWRGTSFTLLFNSDEEIGSPSSRPLFAAEAARHDAAIVLEPARPNGACVIGRKGVGHFRLETFGRQAHAGAQPELGINAIWEMAHKICELQALTDFQRGTTINVGVVRGGERSNVVPDSAAAEIDLRIWSAEEGARAGAAFRVIASRAHIPGATATLTGEIGTPPWQTNGGTRQLLGFLERAGQALGVQVAGVTTGGGSDGSRVAHVIPTLDGLGPVGSHTHSPDEFVEVPSLVERAALLALFIETWYYRTAD
jgi:glutamate carboxypeptidase